MGFGDIHGLPMNVPISPFPHFRPTFLNVTAVAHALCARVLMHLRTFLA